MRPAWSVKKTYMTCTQSDKYRTKSIGHRRLVVLGVTWREDSFSRQKRSFFLGPFDMKKGFFVKRKKKKPYKVLKIGVRNKGYLPQVT
jgi:hypothetical protein